ncbi:phosphate/phosphite/phosphonate ABC transporter substrate-binding protein [Thiocystis violacea]|uniref:phosphate/phosphite/phosphonate ABC transporter substrate-binding protein n=1 Tax=Thiocystis violacea TaxID=13725 RepID=UPI0019070458|nr:phosphate/phosphite/phosphonate ABC transporter substrate-binding protein [Thiocystis violacea]
MKSPSLRHLTLLATLVLSAPVAFADYSISITPRFSPDELLRQITPLAERLTEVLGEKVKVVLTSDFKAMEQDMKAGRIDIAYVNPIIYPLASDAHEALAIVSKGEGGDKLRGLVITRADSEIVSPEDLKGKSATIVSLQSVGGYLSQKVALEKKGLHPETEMRLQEAKDNKQENVALAVYLGETDVGFIREDALHIADKYVPPSQIRVILRGEWMPSWAISVKRSLPQDIKDKIRQAVLDLKPGDPVLQVIKANGFVPGSDADYDVYRKALGLAIPKR